jgi:CheY-like chemotaxis protein
MSKSVLCVEDDAIFCDIIAKTLEGGGFRVSKSSNGEDGLKRAKADKPDAILLDIGLPRKDGFELLGELKASPETSSIPVFMLSRLSTREDIDRCFALGCEDYLIKTQHHPDDVKRRLLRHFGMEDGFARWEVLVALGVLLIAASVLWWQLGHPKPPVDVPASGVELQSS